jgi:hypothetical protein
MLTQRLQHEVNEIIRAAWLSYRVTWASGDDEVSEAFDFRDAYRAARDRAETSSPVRTARERWPVRVEELATGRVWRFDCVGIPVEESAA